MADALVAVMADALVEELSLKNALAYEAGIRHGKHTAYMEMREYMESQMNLLATEEYNAQAADLSLAARRGIVCDAPGSAQQPPQPKETEQ